MIAKGSQMRNFKWKEIHTSSFIFFGFQNSIPVKM